MNPILQFKKMQFSKLYIKYYTATSYAIYPKNWAYSKSNFLMFVKYDSS